MVNFNERNSIYLQIGDYICEKILSGEISFPDRIPSVRELAATLGVNANTCMRTYEMLSQREIIQSQRGLGYTVCEGAKLIVFNERKQRFIKDFLPSFFTQIDLLNISLEEVLELYERRKMDL